MRGRLKELLGVDVKELYLADEMVVDTVAVRDECLVALMDQLMDSMKDG